MIEFQTTDAVIIIIIIERKVPVKFYCYLPRSPGSVFLFARNFMNSAEVVERFSKEKKTVVVTVKNKIFCVTVIGFKSHSDMHVLKLTRSSKLWACNKTLRCRVQSGQAENKIFQS